MMDIAVIGITPYGCAVAALLQDSGADVTLIGPRDRAEAIAASGLTLRQTWDGRVIKTRVRAVGVLDHVPDLLVFATRTQDTDKAALDAAQTASDATIATVQYGNKTDQIVARHLPRKNLITCVLTLGASCPAPGDVTLDFKGHALVGRAYDAPDDRLALVERVMSGAFRTRMVQKVAHYNCTRMLMQLPYCIPAILGRDVRDAFSDQEIAGAAVGILKEGFGVIDAAGVHREPLPDLDEESVKRLFSADPGEAASRFRDIAMNFGNGPCTGPQGVLLPDELSEVENLNGEVANIAGMLDRPAPLNGLMVELARQALAGGDFLSRDDFLNSVRRRV